MSSPHNRTAGETTAQRPAYIDPNLGVAMRLFLIAIGFIAAVAVTHAIGAGASAAFAMSALSQVLGISLPTSELVKVIQHDIIGLLPSYAPIIAIGLAIAFTAAGYVSIVLRPLRLLVFIVAGGCALATVLYLLQSVLGLQPLSGAREMFWPMGFVAQVGAGAVGGLVYALIVRPQRG